MGLKNLIVYLIMSVAMVSAFYEDLDVSDIRVVSVGHRQVEETVELAGCIRRPRDSCRTLTDHKHIELVRPPTRGKSWNREFRTIQPARGGGFRNSSLEQPTRGNFETGNSTLKQPIKGNPETGTFSLKQGGRINTKTGKSSLKQPGPFFMKLRTLGDIHKICISGKVFAFHRSTKDILEHLLF